VNIWENCITELCDRSNGSKNQKKILSKYRRQIPLYFTMGSGASGLRIVTGLMINIHETDSGPVLQ